MSIPVIPGDYTTATAPNAIYQALLDAYLLAYQRCESCNSVVFPPRIACPHCGQSCLGWEASAGRGTIYSSTVISPRNEPAYSVALVDLSEGLRVMTNVTGPDPHAATIGEQVNVYFENVDGQTVALFAGGTE